MPSNSGPKPYNRKEETLHPEYKDTSGLCIGGTNEMYMSFLIFIFHLQKKTSRNSALKYLFTEDFITHMGYDNLSERVTNSYNISKRVCKWTKRTSVC
jgi:hypothetical protein